MAKKKNLAMYVRRVLVHTPKAIKNGAPADRYYLVTHIERTEEDGEFLVAWKVDKLPQGFEHPAYRRPQPKLTRNMFLKKGPKGEQPTACFVPDSYYKVVAKF